MVNSSKVTIIEISESEVDEFVNATLLTKQEALDMLTQMKQLEEEYKDYLKGPFDPRD